ncbi:MAG TPA: class I SAM-dependent methyltransferase [Rhizomicrobium sp.]|jgi:SAM-dependent methyltransferase|nr:class I SAM-dependent methyltransferase [Rhizomicrobium sp.]
MSELCELCRGPDLQLVYRPEGSTRGLSVHLCAGCGLVQSLPRADRAARAPAAVSSGADWGNVRYGKGFRTKATIETIARHVDLENEFSILDVGSNRGSFAKAILAAAPHAKLTAVEPDERVAQSCAELERTELIEARIEEAALETGRFDIVHSCHTIEHLAHPARTLADHWRVLKPGGLLVIDAPNTAILGNDDIVEEWFIDKHLYHFSARTLGRMIEAAGFEIVQQPDAKDRSNLLFVARKTNAAPRDAGADREEVAQAERLIAQYISTRARNLMALTAVAAELVRLAPRGVALWGAGRLFDSLVVHGRFNPRQLTLLIDTHLKALVGERHGCTLAAPDALSESQAGVVVVMSRDFASEIAAHARTLAPHAEILFYSDLIANAQTRLAA